ncbi:cytochrome c biogenesis protein CcsA [Reichenbachiella carrageenanivorans]|uniref:Cytochrome c biogenesis protein CcsA n=1 Tax=Reichenbachiella carrageenanivorans TaxID=2979869 RepID=A0ABY6CX77_9BACT|nr:cytochrome c biogenesis protein CcsA [Reichenbachiella carrageenanivorans]UXX78324.1 cytochrome c biogenesis protein CcsA [Reichenbachiella carrageenanivorans]
MKFLKPLFSNKLTTVLLVVYAFTMAYATFLENDFGTQAVLSIIYKAWWFEVIMILLAVNFAGNIWRYKLYRKEKISILTFHVAFIIILIGAFVTRYVSFEGLMHIREGESVNEIVSQDRYLQIEVKKGEEIEKYEKKLNLSVFKQPNLMIQMGAADEITIEPKAFVPQAEQQVVPSETGSTVLKLVTTSGDGRENLYLASGGALLINNYPVTFDRPVDGAINIFSKGEELYIQSPFEMNFMVMATQTAGMLPKDSLMPLKTRALYRSENTQFVIPEVYDKSAIVYMSAKDQEKGKMLDDLLFVKIKSDDRSQEILLSSFDGNFSEKQHLEIGEYHVDISYGPKPIEVPFSIELRDFQLDRYPGSTSPSSYASEVTVIDGDTSFPYRIYMNNVLDYEGYRFFQASYDSDAKGTVLSVNQDFWGTNITYVGYTLMTLGMLLTLFGKYSRFQTINKKLSQLKAKKTMATVLLVLLGWTTTYAQEGHSKFNFAQSLLTNEIDKTHASQFGDLLVQDMDGRIKPINTLGSEFLRKVHGKSSFKVSTGDYTAKLNSDQVFLMMHVNPLVWQQVPVIKVDPDGGKEIMEVIGKHEDKYYSFIDFLDKEGNYLLSDMVDEASRKKPALQNAFDKELIKVDERFNVFFQGLTGHYLKIFPLEGDPAHTWYADKFEQPIFTGEDSVFVKKIMPMYYQSIMESVREKDWSKADEILGYIKKYQDIKGVDVIPDSSVIKAELLYNKLRLFNHLFSFLWLSGIALLVVAIMQIFKSESKAILLTNKVLTGLVFVGFLALTFNLGLRWYASDHAPWSNGYEMIILVGWGLLFFAFVFYKRSNFVVPLGALFSGTLLFVAFLDWLNPEITNLVPVLKSYWLKIHVAIIVSSYAPLGLSALLGLLTLIFMIVDKKKNPKIAISIKEMTYINEMSMTIGLFLLTIGTFLGGVWANESWGRYWGWDPKETWALISVIVYATVLHLRLIPKLNDTYVFNTASVVAFFSIIMTSFGVNYYLSGLHSYAKGDPLPVPTFVYYTVAIIIAICTWAYFANKKSKAMQ